MRQKPRIIFTTPIFEYPTVHGPSLRIINTLIALSSFVDIYLLILSNFNVSNASLKKFATKYKIKILSRPILNTRAFGMTKIMDVVNTFHIWMQSRSIRTNIIWLGYGCLNINLLKYLKIIKPSLKLICDTDSVQSRYFLRALPYLQDSVLTNKFVDLGHKLQKTENKMVEIADITLAVSEVDQNYYQSIGQNPSRIKLLYNAIDLNKYHKHAIAQLNHPAIILTGWYGKDSPMEDGANWLIGKVWPLVFKEYPQAHLYLIGKGASTTIRDTFNSHIHILGEVADMVPYLTGADISVVPLRYESGTRFKILEASASNVPVVSTTLGAEGLALLGGKDILIADTPKMFASHILSLLKNQKLHDQIAQNARQIVRAKYSLSVIRAQAKQILLSIYS